MPGRIDRIGHIRRSLESFADESQLESEPFIHNAGNLLSTLERALSVGKNQLADMPLVMKVLDRIENQVGTVLKQAARLKPKSKSNEQVAQNLIRAAGLCCLGLLQELEHAFRKSLPPRVFISFANADLKRARRITNLLEDAGVTVFLANDSISLGERWQWKLTNELRSATATVVLMSPHSLASQWVMFEFGTSFGSNIPALIGYFDVKMSQLPTFMADLQSREITQKKDEAKFVTEVLEVIRKHHE